MRSDTGPAGVKPFSWAKTLLWGAAAICLSVQCRLAPEPDARHENYVTVDLNDSLRRFDKVTVQILAAGDTSQVVGTLWSGRLEDPGAIPPYRLDDDETRSLSVRVQAWDAGGRLALDETIVKKDGKSIVTVQPIFRPSPRLASLAISAGSLSPAFSPGASQYSVSVPNSQSSIQVTASPVDAEAQVYVGIRPVAAGKPSDPVPLDTGTNHITVLVLTPDSSAQYLITVLRAKPAIDTAKKPPVDTAKTPPSDTTKTPPTDTTKTPPTDTTKTPPVDTTKTPPVDTTKTPPVDTTQKPPVDTGKTTPSDTAKPANPMPDWHYHGAVILRLPTAGSASPNAIAADFPLLLRLTSANFNFSQAADSGRDIRFLDVNGKKLDYAIARWDASAQMAEIYIRCDTLSPERAAPIYSMYWGNPKATAASAPAAVFPRSRGWTGVWHLDETGYGSNGEYKDATGSYPGTGVLGIPKRVAGVVGYAQDFDGNGSQGIISIPSEFDPGKNHFSMQMWVNYGTRAASYILNKSGAGAEDQRFEIDVTQGSTQISFGRTGTGGSKYIATFGPPPQTWFLLGIVCDGDSVHLYDNGVAMETHPFKLGGNLLSNVVLGARNPAGDAGFAGDIDEFWSFDGARDAWYMRLIYENQKAGSTMATLTAY